MPNYCENVLTVLGPEAAVQRFKKKAGRHWSRDGAEPAAQEEPQVLNFHSLVPVPTRVSAATGFEAAEAWAKKNWGCKCDAVEPIIAEEHKGFLIYQFLTPWSPPIEFVQKAARQFPTLTFVLEYDEPGMRFKGIAKSHGKKHEDHCIEY